MKFIDILKIAQLETLSNDELFKIRDETKAKIREIEETLNIGETDEEHKDRYIKSGRYSRYLRAIKLVIDRRSLRGEL